MKRAVRAAGCVGIMHEDLLQEDVQRREFNFLRLSDKGLTAQNYFCYAPQTPLSPVAEKFVSLLRAARDNKLEIGGRLPGALVSFQPGSSSRSKRPGSSAID